MASANDSAAGFSLGYLRDPMTLMRFLLADSRYVCVCVCMCVCVLCVCVSVCVSVFVMCCVCVCMCDV